MIYLGIDNNSKEYALLNWSGAFKELADNHPDILWYSSFKDLDEVNKFLEWYESDKSKPEYGTEPIRKKNK